MGNIYSFLWDAIIKPPSSLSCFSRYWKSNFCYSLLSHYWLQQLVNECHLYYSSLHIFKDTLLTDHRVTKKGKSGTGWDWIALQLGSQTWTFCLSLSWGTAWSYLDRREKDWGSLISGFLCVTKSSSEEKNSSEIILRALWVPACCRSRVLCNFLATT